MLNEIDKLTHIGDAGVAVAILIALIVISVAYYLVTKINNTTEQQRLRYEHEREMRAIELEDAREHERQAHAERMQAEQIAADVATAKVLETISGQIEGWQLLRDTEQATIKSLATAATQLAQLLETAQATMTANSEERGKKLDAIHADVKIIPAETVRLIQAQLEQVVSDVRSLTGASSRVVDAVTAWNMDESGKVDATVATAIKTDQLDDAQEILLTRLAKKGRLSTMTNGEIHNEIEGVKRKTGSYKPVAKTADSEQQAGEGDNG